MPVPTFDIPTGPTDQIGAANFLMVNNLIAGICAIKTGKVYALAYVADRSFPGAFGREVNVLVGTVTNAATPEVSTVALND